VNTTPQHPHLVALDAFRRALADVDPPTDAELRSYVRTASGRHHHLADDLWALDDVTELAERVRHTGVVHARLHGTKVKPLAQALDVDERTILRNYPLPKVKVRTLPEQNPLELYRRGPYGAAPVVLELHLDDGELSVRCLHDDEEEAMVRRERVATGAWQRWDLPLLTPEGANALMRQARPLAEQVRFGADLDHDKVGRLRARLDAGAEQARREIDQLCADQAQGPYYLVEIEAPTFFGSSAQRTAAEYGLTAASTEDQIAAVTEDAEAAALDGGLVLRGAEEHLTQVVGELEVDTELVLAVMEGAYTGPAAVLELSEVQAMGYPGLTTAEITAWVEAQQPLLGRWVAATFDPIETPYPQAVFEISEPAARDLARAMDTEP
jgi:hypothetical protein